MFFRFQASTRRDYANVWLFAKCTSLKDFSKIQSLERALKSVVESPYPAFHGRWRGFYVKAQDIRAFEDAFLREGFAVRCGTLYGGQYSHSKPEDFGYRSYVDTNVNADKETHYDASGYSKRSGRSHGANWDDFFWNPGSSRNRDYYSGTENPRPPENGPNIFNARRTGTEEYQRILGVSNIASFDDVRSAYKRLAVHNHPDRGGDQAMMAKINVAYSEIMKRKGWPS